MLPILPKIQTPNPFPLGDWAKKLPDALGIKPCSGCKERQRAMNELGKKISEAVKPARKK
jgi:hypothetical protein